MPYTNPVAGRAADAPPLPAVTPPSCNDAAAPTTLPRHALVIALLAALSACAPVDKVFVVDTTDDAHDDVPGDGSCATVEGSCSLRAAIEETNATPGDVGIRVEVGAGVYGLTLDTGVPYAGLTLSRGNVTIQGTGRDGTVIDGLGERRVLQIDGARSRMIYIESLSLVNGYVPTNYNGGAVRIASSELSGRLPYLVSFVDTAIAGSSAGWLGGGIHAQGEGNLNVVDSSVRDNASTQGCATSATGGGMSGGGGIFVGGGGTLHLIHSEVRDNCGSNGGGVRIQGPHGGEHLILGSTIAGNSSMTSGGGLHVTGSGMLVEDSTIAHNEITTADAYGGKSVAGLHVAASAVRIESSTIVDNENPHAFANGAGGLLSDLASVVVRNSVLAGHAYSGYRECIGPLYSDGGNFLGDSDEKCVFVPVGSDIVDGGDPELGPLTYNGGPTRTLRPLTGSPLIDTGVAGCEPIDQRGAGYPAPSGGGCDIGAVERQVAGSGGERLVPGSLADLADGDAPWGEAYPELRRAAERLGADTAIGRDARPGELTGAVRGGGSGLATRAPAGEPGR